MAAKVFVSCGQKSTDEIRIANGIKKLLKDKFALESYLAFKIQSFDDVMQITNELSACDYYLFIDFGRERLAWSRKRRGSLFTHQELAIARHLGFSEIIALQQEKVVLEGFARYILSNPERFRGEADLLAKIEWLVKERGWNKTYSRNLIVSGLIKNPLTAYHDHSLVAPRNEIIWHCQILNRRNDKAAANTLTILKEVEDETGRSWAPDTTFLKWAFQLNDYQKTIFPMGEGRFDLLAVDANNPSHVYLHSLLDTYTPTATGTLARQPIIDRLGFYKLTYQIFAENFPLLEFQIRLNLTGNIDTTEATITN